LLRFVALFLLAGIAVDVAADAGCDAPPRSTSEERAEIAAPSGQPEADPCADFCVPDCFCCSRATGRVAAVVPPAPSSQSDSLPDGHDAWPEGVRPTIDHFPIARG
jgi:hypothetical protein